MLDPESVYGASVAVCNLQPKIAERLDEAAKVNPWAVDWILMPAFTEVVGGRLSGVYRLTQQLHGSHNNGETVLGEYLPGDEDVMYVRIGNNTYRIPRVSELEIVATQDAGDTV